LMYPWKSCCSGFPIATLITTFHHSSAILAKKWISDGSRELETQETLQGIRGSSWDPSKLG
jgi:hypothetical protein